MATFKQFRITYENRSADGLVVGAGACFVIAPGEFEARQLFARQIPNGTVTGLREEPEDPRRIYERPVRS